MFDSDVHTVAGYYIFKNVSAKDDAIILESIKNENNVYTVKANWEKRNLPR